MSKNQSFLQNVILGDDIEELLPKSRKEQFIYFIKKRAGLLILSSLITFAFFIPLILMLFIVNYQESIAIAALDNTTNLEQAISQLVFQYELQKSMLSIPLVMVGFLGLSGLFQVFFNAIRGKFYEGFFQSFKVGIKANFKYYLLYGFIFSLSLSALKMSLYSVYLENSSSIFAFARALSFLQFLLVIVFLFYGITQVVVYQLTFKELLKNSFILGLTKFFPTFGITILLFLPILILILLPSPFSFIALIPIAFLYFGLFGISISCYTMSIFDQYLQPILNEDANQGLRK